MSAAPAIRALTCPNCGGGVEMRAAGLTVSLVCPHCGSILDATDPDFAVLERASAAMRVPEIRLGTRGTLDGAEWEAVGYMERRSEDGGWSEYLLFNPYRGYLFLIDDGERFSVGALLDRIPERESANTVTLDGSSYNIAEEPYPARVTFVVGEFYWRVRVGETVQVSDYSTWGDTSLSAEANDAELTWTRTRKLPPGAAEAAFGLPPRAASGFAAFSAAPGAGSPNLERLKQSLKVAAYAIVALMLLSLFNCSGKVLLSQDLELELDRPGRTIVLGPIELTSALSSLTVRAQTERLDNAWVDLDYSLVDRRTQQSYDAYGAAEFYHGRDSDGNWSEGDRRPKTRFASIPRGSYDLVVEAAAHSWAGGSTVYSADQNGFTFKFELNGKTYGSAAEAPKPPLGTVSTKIIVRRGASYPENFWGSVVLILLWPIFLMWRLGRAATRRDED